MNKGLVIVAVLLIGLGSIAGGLFGRKTVKTSVKGDLTASKVSDQFGEALELIDKNYSREVDREEILDRSIQTMLFSLDPHSSFFTRKELKKLFEEQQSRFFGIGVSILQHRDGVYVQSVVPGTPAAKEGLRYGDRFVRVDGKDATKWSSAELSRNVRGPQGSKVKVSIGRAGTEKVEEIEIVRGGVPYPSIRNHFILKNNIGYVGLSAGFQETTAAELDRAIVDLKQQGMKSLILDLRNNVGGILPQAIEVTSRFVEKGKTVVSVKGRSNYANSEDLRAVGSETHEFPLVVLINGSSASASEIVAGAIQDYGRGVVVGSDSFGKGLVQKIFPLPYGTGLTLTTARYYTPYGRSIQRDYSSGSIYEYFSNASSDDDPETKKEELTGKAVKTAGGRVYYDGRGIIPDLKAPAMAFTDLRYRLNEATFFFARELAAGEVKGFEVYKANKQTFAKRLSKDDFTVSDALFEKFVTFAVNDPKNGLTAANIKKQEQYARAKIREQLATATFSGEAGFQVFVENDPQVLKAIDAVPKARELVDTMLAKR